MKCRSRVPGQEACLLSKSRTIAMQGCIILATKSTENTLQYFTPHRDVKYDSQWNVKCRSRVPGQSACLLSKSSTISMQGFIILAAIRTEKHTLVF